MESQTLRHCRTATNIDLISEDLLHNIVSRLPATSFASAACVSRSWNLICGRLLCRPKLSSAYSLNPSLQAAVEEVVNKVLSEPIRPHFAIVSIDGHFDDGLGEAHRLITGALGTHVPVITNLTDGIIERNADSNKFYKVDCYHQDEEIDAIMLIVGFLPGLRVTLIPLLKQLQEPETFMIDEFVTDIREFSTSVSGRSSPATIIMFCDYCACMEGVIDKLDYAMSPETVIVGDTSSNFRCTNDAQFGTSAAVALLFAVDRNKPPGIGETQFHAVLSSGLSPVGPTYTSVVEKTGFKTNIAARREGSVENMDTETILNQVDDELGGRNQYDDLFIGVTKRRKYSIGKEKVAVEEVVNKLLSQPIRPHFAIASVIGHYYEDGLGDAHQLITRALGTHVPVITDRPSGVIGTDAFSDDFQEDESDAIMLLVGYLPGLKVATIPLLKQIQEPETVMIDEFVTDIREFSTSVSRCNSPAAIIMLSNYYKGIKDVTEKLDYAMSPKTVIVGNTSCRFRFTNDGRFGTSAAVALVFAVDRNKPPGIGETQFHVVLSKGSAPVGPTYKETYVTTTRLSASTAASREGSVENMDGETILNQDKVLSPAFKGVCGNRKWYLFGRGLKTGDMFLKTGDMFRFHHPNSTTIPSSAAAVSSYLRSCSQRSNNTTGVDKLEAFGGLIFTCPDIFSPQVDIYHSPFLDNFPGVTLGGTFCSSVIGRRVLNPLVKESQEQKAVPCCERIYNSLYLIMSYTPLE